MVHSFFPITLISLWMQGCLKLVLVPSFCPITLISLWMPLARAVCYQFGLLITDLCRFCRDLQKKLLVPALPQLKQLCHPLIGTISAAYASHSIIFSGATDIIRLRKMLLKRVGDRRHHCLTSTGVLTYPLMLSFI